MNILLTTSILSFTLGQLTRWQIIGYPLVINFSEILIFITVLCWLIWTVVHHQKIHLNTPQKLILLFSGISLVSLIASLRLFPLEEVVWGSFYLWRWLIFAGLYFVIVNTVKPSTTNYWLRIVFLTGPILAILGFLQLIFFPDFSFMSQLGWDPHFNRLLATFYDPNFLGGYLTLIFIVGLYFLVKEELRWPYILGLILVFIALALTFSRSAYISFSVAVLIVSFLQKSFKWIGVSILLIVLLGMFYLPRLQIEKTRDINRVASAQARVDSWQTGLQIFNTSPILGIGFNNYRSYQGIYSNQSSFENLRPGAGSDSSLVFLLATTGLLGTSIYLIIIFYFAKSAFFSENNFLYLPVLFTLIVDSFFINSLFYIPIMALFWIFLGLNNVERNS